MLKNPVNFERFDRKSRPRPSFLLQIFCFFVERNSMDSSLMLWNKLPS